MCVGLRIKELRSELRRRGRDDGGRRAQLVDRLVVCLRADLSAASSPAARPTATAAAAAAAPGVDSVDDEAYHRDRSQPMWGWSDYFKGKHVFITSTTHNLYGVKNRIIGAAETRGGFEGALSNHKFKGGTHWFQLSGEMVNLCFISVVDPSSRSQDQLAAICASDNTYSNLFRGADGFATGEQSVSLCTGNHVLSSTAARGEKTVVCLDADAREGYTL